jgi:hypothetical protein
VEIRIIKIWRHEESHYSCPSQNVVRVVKSRTESSREYSTHGWGQKRRCE